MYILRKRARKSKNILFFYFMTTFYNFALKKETTLSKRVAKPISETKNNMDVIVYASFIYSFLDKKFCIVWKNNSKCTKFTIKN